MYDKYKGDFFTFLENDNPLYFYCSLKEYLIFWMIHFRSKQCSLLTSLSLKDYCIHSFWSQHTERRAPRCWSVSERDEHLKHSDDRWMSISFFVCFSNQIVEFFLSTQTKLVYFSRNRFF